MFFISLPHKAMERLIKTPDFRTHRRILKISGGALMRGLDVCKGTSYRKF